MSRESLRAGLTISLVFGAVGVATTVSFATLVFGENTEEFLNVGIAHFLLGGAVAGIILAFASSIRGQFGGIQDVSAALAGAVATSVTVSMAGSGEEAIFAIKLTLEEAVTNSIKHGNKCDPNKKVTVRYFVDERQVVVFVRDEGPGFNPEAVPDPTSPDRLSLPNGRGILLMRAYMDGVEYRENGREICFLKRKS